MDFTFGIITTGSSDHFLNTIIDSIRKNNIPNYEIIIVGKTSHRGSDIVNIDFDESIKPSWITKKKNLITQHAKYENVVYSHDYVFFHPNWYEEFLKFGNDFKICMNQIIDGNGANFRDWIVWWTNDLPSDVITHCGQLCSLPYHETGLSKLQYISGTYWVAKKHVMEEFPLDENLVWNEGEDVVWSKQVRQTYNFSINPNSKVQFLKYKGGSTKLLNDSEIKEIYRLLGM